MFAVAVFLCISVCVTSTSAHSASQEDTLAGEYLNVPNSAVYNQYFVGGEKVGWSINENQHQPSAGLRIEYTVNTDLLTDNHLGYLDDAAEKWYSYCTFVYSSKSSAQGYVTGNPDLDTDTYAGVLMNRVDEDGHFTGAQAWTMKINTELPVTSTTIAHEFGHVIGLNDLYDSANSNKLMFGYERRTANGLTAYDRRGAEVILGEHPKSNTPHNFEYVYYGTTYGIKFHAKQCSYCYGFQGSGSTLTGYGACTYGAGSVCTVCGTSR